MKKREGIYIIKPGKLCGGYYCQNRHSKPWGVKEGGDTSHIRAWPGKLFVQAENHLDLLIWSNRLTHFKRLGLVSAARYWWNPKCCVITIILFLNYMWRLLIFRWRNLHHTCTTSVRGGMWLCMRLILEGQSGTFFAIVLTSFGWEASLINWGIWDKAMCTVHTDRRRMKKK